MIRAITPITASLLFALALGCDSPAEKQADKRTDAKKDVADATKDAKKQIEDAKEDLKAAEVKYGEKLGDAQKDVGKEVVDAGKEIAEADKDAATQAAKDRYVRFEILKDETETAFASRADTELAKLKTDLEAARTRATKSGATKDLTDSVAEASKAFDEAAKHLDELRTKKGKIFDEGRNGVTTSINKAQTELSEAYQELVEAKM